MNKVEMRRERSKINEIRNLNDTNEGDYRKMNATMIRDSVQRQQ
jgi:hypothetical protein